MDWKVALAYIGEFCRQESEILRQKFQFLKNNPNRVVLQKLWENYCHGVRSQLLLFMPPSPRTPYFSIQKLSLASMTKGSELRIFSKGKKLKSASSWPGWLKWSPTPVSGWWVTAALCSVHLFLHGLVAPTFPIYWAGLRWHCPAPWEQVML